MAQLPKTYSASGGQLEDIEELWRLMVAVSLAETGTRGWGLVDLETWLTGVSMDMAEDVLMVRDDSGNIVGAEVFDLRGPFVRPHAIGGVHPDHCGIGIGSYMLDWAIGRAVDSVAKAAPDAAVTLAAFGAAGHPPTEALMADAGMTLARFFLDMEIDFEAAPPPPLVPSGVTIRRFDPDRELEELAETVEEGFRDHYGFVPSPLEQRVARLRHWMSASDFDPDLWWVAEGDRGLIGANLCLPAFEGDDSIGYVASLSVLPAHRGRGLGKALLLEAFNAFYRRGKKGAALGVDADSLTGATRLYESVGMRPGAEYASWERVIRPGIELATLELGEN